MKKKFFTLSLIIFAIVFSTFSQSTRAFMHLTNGHDYIIKSVYDPTKVMTIRAGSSQATMETYVAGDNDQVWHITEQYPNSPVWFFYVDNIGKNLTFALNGNYHAVNHGAPYLGWNFEWNDTQTAVRMCNFEERWNDPNGNGCFMTLDPTGVDNKVTGQLYTIQIGGVKNADAYNAVTTTGNMLYFDYTLVDISTLTSVSSNKVDNFYIYAQANNIILDNVAGKKVDVYSIEGKIVKQIKSANLLETIPVQNGIYIVKIEASTKKITVN
ncbi:MAG: T9SS type A sorting domain-containing protein [Paludibacter sp.]|nr:T9SS type A sorting domain-containing protein [Paludibacter sp.]